MRVILFGATGMVGHGVLRECLRDDGVERVLAVGRSPTGRTHPKLRELVRKDLLDFGAAGADLQGDDGSPTPSSGRSCRSWRRSRRGR